MDYVVSHAYLLKPPYTCLFICASDCFKSCVFAGVSVAPGGSAAGWRLNTGGQTGAAEPRIASGAGAPADELALPNGSLYLRTDGERGSTLYLREGGTWVPR